LLQGNYLPRLRTQRFLRQRPGRPHFKRWVQLAIALNQPAKATAS